MSGTLEDPLSNAARSVRAQFRSIITMLWHPSLIVTALIVARGLVPSKWWRRPPFLPIPDRAWLEFRLETAYGSKGFAPPEEDLVGYLRWCKMMRKIA